MKTNALVIAAAIAVLSTAFPKNAKAENYDFWYAYQGGGLAMLCDLHINGIISTDVVKEASKNFTSPEPHIPAAATRDAIKTVLEIEEFKSCPIPSP
jgi:hypothetical protein